MRSRKASEGLSVWTRLTWRTREKLDWQRVHSSETVLQKQGRGQVHQSCKGTRTIVSTTHCSGRTQTSHRCLHRVHCTVSFSRTQETTPTFSLRVNPTSRTSVPRLGWWTHRSVFPWSGELESSSEAVSSQEPFSSSSSRVEGGCAKSDSQRSPTMLLMLLSNQWNSGRSMRENWPDRRQFSWREEISSCMAAFTSCTDASGRPQVEASSICNG